MAQISGRKTNPDVNLPIQIGIETGLFRIEALLTNQCTIAIGGPNVRAAEGAENGWPLAPGEHRDFNTVQSLNTWYLSVRVANDGIRYCQIL